MLDYQLVTHNGEPGTLVVQLPEGPEFIHRGSDHFDAAVAVVRDDTLTDEAKVERLRAIARPISGLAAIDDSRVTVEGRRVMFDGEGVPTALTRKLLAIQSLGLDLTPWKRFMVRLFSNPNRAAQAELNEFLEAGNLPVTEDGCFLAYKRVQEDYTDCYSGTFDNSVGKVVQMEREDVDADRNRTCSRGLHFCSQDYLQNFYRGSGRIVIVKVDPADVVSIPIDYNFTKGRTWRYVVVGEVELDAEHMEAEWGVYEDRFVHSYDEPDPLDWEVEWADDESDEDDDWDEWSDEIDAPDYDPEPTESTLPPERQPGESWFGWIRRRRNS